MAATPPQQTDDRNPGSPTGSPAGSPTGSQAQSPRDSSDLYALDLPPGSKPPKGFMRGRTVVIACALLVVSLFALNLGGTMIGNRRDARLVADKASLNSPRVSHVLENTVDGVVERWTVAKPGDSDTRGQIRRATSDLLVTRRNMGDFSVGAKKNLTGREVVETGIDKITITRSEVAGGVEIRYATTDSELQSALQSWATAQQE